MLRFHELEASDFPIWDTAATVTAVDKFPKNHKLEAYATAGSSCYSWKLMPRSLYVPEPVNFAPLPFGRTALPSFPILCALQHNPVNPVQLWLRGT